MARIFNGNKRQIMGLLSSILHNAGMQLIGCNKKLGLISLRGYSQSVFYVHLVEIKNGSTRVSIAPGLSYLKERDQSEVPKSTTKRLMDELCKFIKNDNKYYTQC